jgi:hypothetical protein
MNRNMIARETMDTSARMVEVINAMENEKREYAEANGREWRGDSGIVGKAFEVVVREYIQPYSKRNNGHASRQFTGYGDMRIGNTIKVEIKSACGELGEGYEYSDILPLANYVIYCPEVSFDVPIEQQAFVFTRNDFITMLSNYPGRGSLVRFGKKATNGSMKIAIQSFYSETRKGASKALASYLWDACYEQPTISDWISEIEGGEEQ